MANAMEEPKVATPAHCGHPYYSNTSDSPERYQTPVTSPQKESAKSPKSSGQKRTYDYIDQSTNVEFRHEATNNTETDFEDDSHDDKRSRGSDWPLRSSSRNGTPQKFLRTKKSFSPRRRSARKSTRPSKFIEGSMNDRPSGRPPSVYTKDEKAMDQYLADQEDVAMTDMEEKETFYDAGIERARPSSMYRFGKALANVFNPLAVWQGMSGIFKEKPEEETSTEKTVLQERQEKAEKAYAELKKAGFSGTNGGARLRHSVDAPSVTYQSDDNSQLRRDSGIDVESYRSSTERKRDGIVFDPAVQDALMPPLPIPQINRRASPMSEAPSGHRSLHLHKPSFASLKKVKSHLHIPTSKRSSASPAPVQSVETDNENSISEQDVLRKQPSRKDLQKQQKLYKKVSNLESQLEKARRELQNAMENAPPVPSLPAEGTPLPRIETPKPIQDKPLPIPHVRTRGTLRPFVPGALASLPSERILNDEAARAKLAQESGHVHQRHKDNNPIPTSTSAITINESSTAGLSTPRTTRSKAQQTSNTPRLSQTQNNNLLSPLTPQEPTLARRTSARQRRSIYNIFYHDPDFIDPNDPNDSDFHPTRKSSHPAKASKLSKKSSPSSMATKTARPPSATPTNTHSAAAVTPNPFDPSQIDLPALLAKRKDPTSSALFGTLGEDVTNLQKEYPDMTFDQLLEYVRKALAEDALRAAGVHKATRDKGKENAKVLATPEEVVFNFGTGVDGDEELDEVMVMPATRSRRGDPVKVSPMKSRNVPPVPRIPEDVEAKRASLMAGEEGKDGGEFVWDEDVF